jgi:hypothetical protein
LKTKLLALAAVAALALGAGATNAAMPSAPGAAIGPEVSNGQAVAPAGYSWRYREFWRGNGKVRTLYVTNGYRWAYRYRYQCV